MLSRASLSVLSLALIGVGITAGAASAGPVPSVTGAPTAAVTATAPTPAGPTPTAPTPTAPTSARPTPTATATATPRPPAATPPVCAHVPGDFNGDGHGDVATTEPYRTVNSRTGVGAVRVLYGAAAGLAVARNQLIDEASLSSLIVPGASDHFGISVVSGYFNSDCYADLAIGAPGANAGVGSVFIVYGSAAGLDTTHAQRFTTTNVDASATGKQKFGWSLAAADFNGDGTDDLAVGTVARGGFAGGTDVLYGSGTNGISATHAGEFTEATPGIPGTAAKGDQFGYALAAGDFNGDGKADLAIGVPGKQLLKAKQAGMVVTMTGSAAGLSAATARYWRQGLAGLDSTPEVGDGFGAALAAGSVTGHTWDDLAVGAPGETLGKEAQAGSVQIIRGSATGLTGTGSQTWTQHNPLIPGDAENGDQFGFSLAMGDLNGDGHADLAIGTPYEDLGATADAGNVTVLYGTATGIATAHAQTWSQASTGIAGGAEKKDDFGYSVEIRPVRSAARSDLVIGDPGEDASGYSNDGAMIVILSTPSGLSAIDNESFNPATLTAGAQNFARMGYQQS